MLKQLIEMAKKLFGENKPVSIREHMAKLDTLLAMREDMIQDVYLEEKKVARELLHIIEDNQPEDYHYYPGDLAAALISFIKNNMEEDEAQKGRLKSLVFNIFQIEAAPAASKGKVHICMADIGRLPGPAGRLLWPLDENLLRQIVSDSGNKYLGLWIEDNHLTHLANRNYIYSAFNNPDVEISWIRKQGDKVLSPSPYITLLERLTDLKIESSVTRDLTMDKVAGIYAHKRFDREYDIRNNADMHSYDSEMEYALCPMRFVYSNVLGNRPTYANEYLQNRAIVRMIQILYRLLGKEYDVNEVAKQVLQLFPNIRKAEKRQLLDDAKRWRIPKPEMDYTIFDGKRYTDWRLNLTFTDEKSYEQARSLVAKLMSQEGRRDISYEPKGESGSHNCEFCPHARYCRRAIFGVDYKEEL